MIYAKKIKMKPGCNHSHNLLEIDSIYLTGCKKEGLYKKEDVNIFLVENPKVVIKVDIGPTYPPLLPAISIRGERYVKSTPNSTKNDNLLALPRA